MAYTLRDLPLPVKVVATVFLLAVGSGYLSAMVQLHMQDSKSGKPMPTVADVILKYTGKKKVDPNAPPAAPMSRLESLVTNPTVAISGQSMSGAFTKDDRAKGELKYANAIKGKSPELVEIINAQRAGEQKVFKLWINLPDADRRAAYEADKFEVPAAQMPNHLTNAFRAGTTVKIKSIIDNRCVTCHSKGGEKEDVSLETYDDLAKWMKVDAPAPSGDWVKVEEPISVTKLTQSTHAHLLSFAVLFSLTGLIFALSSYPTAVRCVLGPWVVVAVFADVSLWWLARLSDQWGPYFAMGIIATGGLAGLGLGGQITLSLFNMYGRVGKGVIGLLFALGLGIVGAVGAGVVAPALSKKAEPPKADAKAPDAPPQPAVPNPPQAPKDNNPPKLSEAQLKELRAAFDDLTSRDAAKQQAARQTFDAALGEAKRKEIEEAFANATSDVPATRFIANAKLADVRTLLGIAAAPPLPKTPALPPSHMEILLTFPVKGPDGKILTMEETPWAGGEHGNMARAFYDKDKTFKEFFADAAKTPADKEKLRTERDGERLAVIAWVQTGDAARKSAYDSDALPLPPEPAVQLLTSKYLKDGKIAVKTIIADRCLRCHGEGGKQYDEYPLDTYEGLKKYMHPDPAAAALPKPKDAPAVPAAAPAPKPINPIPDAKDD